MDDEVKLAPWPPVERPYRFVGGPWDGRESMEPRAMIPTAHCMPNGMGGATWASADSWIGMERYVPDHDDGDTVVMQWRTVRPEEIMRARYEREERDRDAYYRYMDELDDGLPPSAPTCE